MARGDDVIGFTRIFVLFATLVLLPALFMSGFGVIAIVNERQADKQRRREAGEQFLRAAELKLVNAIDTGDHALRAGLEAGRDPTAVVDEARAQGAAIGPWALFPNGVGEVQGSGPFLQPALQAQLLRLSASARSNDAVHVSVDDPAFVGVVSLQRLAEGRAIVYAIDEDRLQKALPPPVDDLRVFLRVDSAVDDPIPDALARLLTSDPVVVEELVVRRLEAPFTRFTLVVEAPPSSSTTIVVVYIVLLVSFLVTLIAGVVITARLIWEETRLSRLKTDFVSHMSHELRTPLTSIRMFIETLKLGRAESPEEQQECLDLLAKETERLSEMIERVLGYARIKAGRRLFRQEDVDVKEIIDDVIDAFRAHTVTQANGSLTLETSITEGLPLVHADREAIVEALLNLVGNAWKYTGLDKRIVLFARPGRRGRIVVGVADNGPGLAKLEHKRIFERFYQARSLLSGKTAGSGLGLAISKAIVEGQGGRIGVESEPGAGSTFWIELRPSPKKLEARPI
ncbi:MAG: ATP-binding protein [Deltaproteobacteria bacterium]|nr:ATP-binding protein [Deltaproteobacteria bacterium]